MLATQLILDDMAEERILIVGLGKTGLSCARFLARQGYPVAVTDSRLNPPELDALRDEFPDIAIFSGGFDENAFNAAKQIVVSPGVSLDEPLIARAIDDGKKVIGDIELFARNVTTPVVAITGSNGKSTVTTLFGEMAKTAGVKVSTGGNLGTPVLDLLAENRGVELFVIELSSFQLETTYTLNPVASVVLNISADHMDRYRDIEHYAAVKRKIMQGDGVVVVNKDDVRASRIDDNSRKKRVFGLEEPNENEFGVREHAGESWIAKGSNNLVNVKDLKIHGRHNIANVLASLALADAIGIALEKTIPALKEFPGLPHRMQWVDKINDVSWYNDSKATNIGAAIAAIDSVPQQVVLIAGGEGKDADFSQMRDVIEKKVRAVVLMGRDAGLIANAIGDLVRVEYADDMESAVNMAASLSHTGDAVLLAPACASFDMYSGFEERGLDFMTRVKSLASRSM